MNRRSFTKLAGAASLFGSSGCLAKPQAKLQASAPSFDFAGVIVESLPTAERHQPLDVTVRIEQAGTTKYHKSHTVEDIVYGVAFRVIEGWMDQRVPYAVTVSSPAHEAITYTTARLDEEDKRGKFSNESVYFLFQLTANTILFRPIPKE